MLQNLVFILDVLLRLGNLLHLLDVCVYILKLSLALGISNVFGLHACLLALVDHVCIDHLAIASSNHVLLRVHSRGSLHVLLSLLKLVLLAIHVLPRLRRAPVLLLVDEVRVATELAELVHGVALPPVDALALLGELPILAVGRHHVGSGLVLLHHVHCVRSVGHVLGCLLLLLKLLLLLQLGSLGALFFFHFHFPSGSFVEVECSFVRSQESLVFLRQDFRFIFYVLDFVKVLPQLFRSVRSVFIFGCFFNQVFDVGVFYHKSYVVFVVSLSENCVLFRLRKVEVF